MKLLGFLTPALLFGSLLAPLPQAAYAAPSDAAEAADAADVEPNGDADIPATRDSEDATADEGVVPGSVDYYRDEIRKNPKSFEAQYNLGLAYAREEDWDQAIEAYQAAADLAEDQGKKLPQAYLNKGVAYGRLKRTKDEVEAYRQAIADSEGADPRYFSLENAHFNLGSAYIKDRNYSAAADQFKEVVQRNPKDVQAQYNLAVTSELLGRHQDAATAYKQVITLDPKDAQSWYHLGVVSGYLNRTDDEIFQYRKAASLNPYLPDLYLRLGNAYSKKKQWVPAYQAYKRALNSDPTDSLVYFNIAVTYFNRGMTKEGIAALRQAKRYDPGDQKTNEILNDYQSTSSGVTFNQLIIRDPRLRRRR